MKINKEMYEKALEIATKAHEGQKRWNGDDYIIHPIRIANSFKDYKLKIIAILHEVVEDSNVSVLDLLEYFPIEIIHPLKTLTHYENESYAGYIHNIKRMSIEACQVKVQDLIDNLEDLRKGHHRDKYELALYYLERE